MFLSIIKKSIFKIKKDGFLSFISLIVNKLRRTIFKQSKEQENESTSILTNISEIKTEFECILQVDNFLSGGMENVVIDQAVDFNNRGISTAILVLGTAGSAVALAREKGINVIIMNYSMKAYDELLSIVNPKAIFAHYSFVGALQARHKDIVFIQVVHNLYVWVIGDKVKERLISDSIVNTSCFICVSEGVKEFFIKYFAAPEERCITIENGIDTTKFLKSKPRLICRKRLGVTEDDFLFINVASICNQKNISSYINAAIELSKKYDNVKFINFGPSYDDNLKNQLSKKIDDSGLKDRIIFWGYVEDVENLYAAADCVVSCSFYEGSALSLLEALVSGCKIISTRVGIFHNIVIDNNQINLIDPPIPIDQLYLGNLTSPEDFDKKLEEVMDCVYLQGKQRIILDKFALGLLDKTYMFSKYQKVMNELVNGADLSCFEGSDSWLNQINAHWRYYE